MKSSSLQGLLGVLILGTSLVAQSPNGPGITGRELSRGGVRIACPLGWNVLEESAEEITIGNYVRSPDTPKNVLGGPDKATMSFKTLPAAYKDLAQWIFAAKKIAPDSIESKISVQNKAIANQSVTRLGSPPGHRATYDSYFFQAGRTPIFLELTYNTDDPKKKDYPLSIVAMIEGAQVAK